MKVVIFLFDQVDLLDAGGPYEVFLTASRLSVRAGEPAPFEVATAGVTRATVSSYGGLRLEPELAASEVAALELLVVPGAVAIDAVIASPALVATVAELAARAEVVASVCTGAFILQAAGLLGEREWTTHWEDIELLAARTKGRGRSGVRWVDSGPLVTAGGLSSGLAMALHLVERFAGLELALSTAKQLEYDWTPQAGTTVG
jgi:transcriptional regulator GlxA family with amidase domain